MCGLTSSHFNDLEAVAAQPVTNLEYGLCTLHAWIRCFENLLHISYRLPKDEQASGKPKLNETRKRQVQSAFKEPMGLRVDEPRPGGVGNSNDGNTARRAFRSAAEFALCTGVDEQLIKDIRAILEAISCFHQVDAAALSAFCRGTAERYVRLYPWYPMATTMHRVLAHSAAVVQNCHLPIGIMSEEAAESANKRIRQSRLRHTRKTSRRDTMHDMFSYLMVASDPVLSSMGLQRRRRLYAKRQGRLQPETLALLAEPALPDGEDDTPAAYTSGSSSYSDDSSE